jgi:23S rRNA (uracil1939-C5)-methyltransferase
MEATHQVLPIDRCPQLDPALDAALACVRGLSPPDGELAVLLGHRGDVVVGVTRPWRGAAAVVGQARIVGVVAGREVHGAPVIEVEPGLWGGPWDFAQASAAGNAALIARTRAAVGPGRGRLVELYAGAGNLTRGLVEDGWQVVATDGVAPARPVATDHRTGPVADVLSTIDGPVDAVVLDPPRAGAADAIEGIVRLAPKVIVYVACDPATLARDLDRLVAAGYRATEAWPIDLMPQTAHVEVVVRVERP